MSSIELLILIASLAFCVAGIAMHTIGVSPALRRGAACLWAAAEAVDAARLRYRESRAAALAEMER